MRYSVTITEVLVGKEKEGLKPVWRGTAYVGADTQGGVVAAVERFLEEKVTAANDSNKDNTADDAVN